MTEKRTDMGLITQSCMDRNEATRARFMAMVCVTDEAPDALNDDADMLDARADGTILGLRARLALEGKKPPPWTAWEMIQEDDGEPKP